MNGSVHRGAQLAEQGTLMVCSKQNMQRSLRRSPYGVFGAFFVCVLVVAPRRSWILRSSLIRSNLQNLGVKRELPQHLRFVLFQDMLHLDMRRVELLRGRASSCSFKWCVVASCCRQPWQCAWFWKHFVLSCALRAVAKWDNMIAILGRVVSIWPECESRTKCDFLWEKARPSAQHA